MKQTVLILIIFCAVVMEKKTLSPRSNLLYDLYDRFFSRIRSSNDHSTGQGMEAYPCRFHPFLVWQYICEFGCLKKVAPSHLFSSIILTISSFDHRHKVLEVWSPYHLHSVLERKFLCPCILSTYSLFPQWCMATNTSMIVCL